MAIGEVGGNITGLEGFVVKTAHLEDDLIVYCGSEAHQEQVRAAVSAARGRGLRHPLRNRRLAGDSRPSEVERSLVKLGGSLTTAVPTDWRERFVTAYDIEIQEWVNGAQREAAGGPSAWDGYLATVVSESATTSLSSGALVPVTIADRPSLY